MTCQIADCDQKSKQYGNAPRLQGIWCYVILELEIRRDGIEINSINARAYSPLVGRCATDFLGLALGRS